ncbi:MAG: leucine-rich repeat domain-containing protein [Candidatus Kapaibacteriota bacterium]
MKKFAIIVFLFSYITIMFGQNLDYAKRLLKLANTNVWLEKYDLASQQVDEAKRALSKFNSWEAKYWGAVADETLGHIYFQMGNYDFAEKYYLDANSKFKELIKSKFEGSQKASFELVQKAKKNKLQNDISKVYSIDNKDNKIVNLSYTNITGFLNLPKDIVGFVAESGNLNKLPAELYGKQNLKILVLSNNRLSETMLREMPSLEYLDLSNNNISTIQIDVPTVANLKYIDLSYNRLKNIPIELLSMNNLQLIDLRGNQIPFAEIASLIQNLPNTTIVFDRYEKVEEEEE